MSYSLNPEELIVDLFAGGGGASTGIELAMGRSPNVAINHDPAAVQMHMANHPASEHHCESIYDVEPRMVTRGKPVGILWASPSCTHFSRARGGTPVSKQERGLGWMIPKWAGLTRPRIIICENVPEWVTWGPVRRGRPVKRKAGQYFKLMKSQLTAMGYVVEDRVLNAADYGTPTSRKRLFLIARNDGQSIVWPEPTHGPRAAKSYRAAAECIDWNDLGHSIFERKKPLAAATCRRIAAGIVRHVIQAKEPFIVNLRGTNAHHLDASASSIHDPLRTISAGGNHHALCTVFLEKHYSGAIHHGVQAIPASLTAPDHR